VAGVVGALLLLGAVGGCQTMGPHAPEGFEVPREGNAELVFHLADQPFVTAEAACRAAYLLVHETPFDGEYAALVEALREEKLIRGMWEFPALHYLTNGDIGTLICRACDIRSGLNWQLTGLGRYAWRELQYKRIAGLGSELQLMSGGEFVGILNQAADYMAQQRRRGAEPSEVPPPA
jgi:hypothetical protein